MADEGEDRALPIIVLWGVDYRLIGPIWSKYRRVIWGKAYNFEVGVGGVETSTIFHQRRCRLDRHMSVGLAPDGSSLDIKLEVFGQTFRLERF